MPRRKELILAALALLLVASVPPSARADCEPEAVVGSTVTEQTADADTAVHCEQENDVWSPNDAFNDSGYGRDMTTGTDTTRAEANVYVWAEDGDSAYIGFSALVRRGWSFATICHPAGSHAVPPYGACDHAVSATVSIRYNAGASGGSAQRSGSATMLARMPTGRSLLVDWQTEDDAAKDHLQTVDWSVDSQGTMAGAVEVSGNLSQIVGLKLAGMSSASISGVVHVKDVTQWTDNSTVSASEILEVVDQGSIETECHGSPFLRNEVAAVEGTLDVGPTESSSDNSIVHGDFKVHQTVEVVSLAVRVCGDEVVVPPPSEPGTPTDPGTGGETTPPDDPGDPDGGTSTEDPDAPEDGAEPEDPSAVGGEGDSTGSDATAENGGDATAEPDPEDPTEETDPVDPVPDPNEPAPDDPPETPNGWGLARLTPRTGGTSEVCGRTV